MAHSPGEQPHERRDFAHRPVLDAAAVRHGDEVHLGAGEPASRRRRSIVESADRMSLQHGYVGDPAWARALGAACRAEGVAVRAQLILHSRGVRWLAPDDIA
jgi:hypothetical protein